MPVHRSGGAIGRFCAVRPPHHQRQRRRLRPGPHPPAACLYVGGTFNCTFNAGGIVNSCAGSSITVNIGVRIPAGSSLRLAADSILSAVIQNSTDPPGQMTFTTFSGGGWFDRCGPPVTSLRLINTANPNVTIASVTGLSLPITCR